MEHLSAFLIVAAAVIVSPGPDTVLTIGNVLAAGSRRGISTALGVATGQAIWATTAAFGLAVAVQRLHPLFVAIRVAGALYLVYLGTQTARAAFNDSPVKPSPTSPAAAHRRGFTQGLISNLTNPKMVLFFIGLMPQFSPRGSVVTSLTLDAVFCAMTFLWLGAYSLAVGRAAVRLRSRRVRRAIGVTAGTILAGFGLELARDFR